MMEQDEFERYLIENQAAFAAWGTFISSKINEKISQKLGKDEALMFLKVLATPRVKTVSSALGKVSRKGYEDPVNQMTDLVGVRFVVLLSSHIEDVSSMIESSLEWKASISKDYLSEIDKNPKLFDYQSKHYEVRPISDLIYDEIKINKNICCEVQIRTLLQHAYAELVHDSVYKPVGEVPKAAERQIARSMALMETTDELFCNTMEILTNVNKLRNDFLADLQGLFKEKIGNHYLNCDLKINYLLLDEFRDYYDEGSINKILTLINKKKYIITKVKQRSETRHIFSQPCILFLYWLSTTINTDTIKSRWPLPGSFDDLEIILSDTGNSTAH
ncbi:RelA/SpoT domain-containing protein [Serratia sp. UGAL515B_01]|uniref:GTP pyrophosphokinase n=1 Tax=Serratia sp. UGAL515B_01 TaxID=2986763 RepID=UPI00295387B6|nr:RelA/SpoT domain-containing protein [Serratia sp. UGAL515B_01]WON77815.1 RelA/SpoT domain-containing protein [Serratia sp. UGAL515B_01]